MGRLYPLWNILFSLKKGWFSWWRVRALTSTQHTHAHPLLLLTYGDSINNMARSIDIDHSHPLTLVRLEREPRDLEQRNRWMRKQSRTQMDNLERGFVHSPHRWLDGNSVSIPWGEWSNLQDFLTDLSLSMREFPDGSYVLYARTRKGRFRSYARFDWEDGGVQMGRGFRYTHRRKVRAVFLELADEQESLAPERIKFAQKKQKIVQ